MNIYEYRDYKKYLQLVIDNSNQKWGYQSKLAMAAKCQKTYFSRVLNGSAELSTDQGYAIAQFLKLNSSEVEFFILLIRVSRAASNSYKIFLQDQVEKTILKMAQLSNRLKEDTSLGSLNNSIYYSSWVWSAIHILVGSPGYQNSSSIAEKLNLSTILVESILQQLKVFKLVREVENGWEIISDDVHLPSKSLAMMPYHQTWRVKAMEYHLQQKETDFFYSSVQTITKSDVKQIREQVVSFVQNLRESVVASPGQEELVAFCCDYFVL